MAASDITLPLLGETVEEAVIVKWFKQAGQSVKRGEALLEAETDKITVEVPALVSGTITEVVAAEGESVKVGAVIARFREEGAAAAAPVASAFNKLRASPAARRAARELGIDLTELRSHGTGPLGRITKADVVAFADGRPTAAAGRAASSSVTTAAARTPHDESSTFADALPATATDRYELTRVEQVSARLTERSFREIPHFYVTLTCDMTAAVQALRALPESRKASINDAIVKVTALALQRHPRLNSTLADGGLQLHPRADIGVITATDEGVITSVVPDAASASLLQIRDRVREVRSRLRSGQARPSDVSGATFCISNMGMYGVDQFSAIILPPNVAILAVSSLKEEVLVEDGRMRIGQTIALTVSADHRAVDGVAVALFLKDVQRLLAEPHVWIEAA